MLILDRGEGRQAERRQSKAPAADLNLASCSVHRAEGLWLQSMGRRAETPVQPPEAELLNEAQHPTHVLRRRALGPQERARFSTCGSWPAFRHVDRGSDHDADRPAPAVPTMSAIDDAGLSPGANPFRARRPLRLGARHRRRRRYDSLRAYPCAPARRRPSRRAFARMPPCGAIVARITAISRQATSRASERDRLRHIETQSDAAVAKRREWPARFPSARSGIKRRAIGIARPVFARAHDAGDIAARTDASVKQAERIEFFQSARRNRRNARIGAAQAPPMRARAKPNPRRSPPQIPAGCGRDRCPRSAAEIALRISRARSKFSRAPNRRGPNADSRSATARSGTFFGGCRHNPIASETHAKPVALPLPACGESAG